MEPAEYQAWLAGAPPDEAPAAAGAGCLSAGDAMPVMASVRRRMAGLYMTQGAARQREHRRRR